jgi:CHAD domain-containing protein
MLETDFKRVRRISRAYQSSASPKRVHDIRTALRRVQARAGILPKRQRKRLSKYLKVCKRVLRVTAKIRDSDVVYLRLANFAEFKRSQFLSRIQEKRRQRVKDTLKLVNKLSNEPVRLDFARVDNTKLKKRFENLSVKLRGKIDSLLPKAVSDSTLQEDLHIARKACKELRYILEANPDENMMETLRKWQTILGDIHDSDVVIAWLSERKQNRTIARVKTRVEGVRAKQFENFMRLFLDKQKQANSLKLVKGSSDALGHFLF